MVKLYQGRSGDGYMTLDASQASVLIPLNGASNLSIQVVVEGVDGSATGELVIQASNLQSDTSSDWTDIYFYDSDLASQDGYDVSSTDFTRMFNITDLHAGYVRLYYNYTSGTGGLNFYPVIKR